MKKFFLIFLFLFLLFPLFSFAQEPVNACPTCAEPGGLVPCGRVCNDPTTPENECLPCTFCDFFVMVDKWIDMCLDVSIPLIIVIIIGIVTLTAYARRGAPEIVVRMRTALFWTAVGIAVTFGAWAVINFALMVLGFTSWSGMGSWWTINCAEKEEIIPLAETSCGDNKIQQPNGTGLIEKCDGIDLALQTCESQGYKGGNLKCLDDCSDFDYSECEEIPPLVYSPPSLPEATPLNPIPLVPAPIDIVAMTCNFDGSWEFQDQGAGNDFDVTCRNGVITGICGERCVLSRKLIEGEYCCESGNYSSAPTCNFEGTWLFYDDGPGNDFAFTCRNGVVTGWCSCDRDNCPPRRGINRGDYSCEKKDSSENLPEEGGAAQTDCRPSVYCTFDGTWYYHDDGAGNDLAITCRNNVVTGFCGGGEGYNPRRLIEGEYNCEY